MTVINDIMEGIKELCMSNLHYISFNDVSHINFSI